MRRTARAAGLETILARVVRGQSSQGAGVEDQAVLSGLRDELTAEMFALQSQLLAVEFEVECIRALINQTRGDYEEAETDRQLALTITSLVIGAGTAITSAAWDLANGHTDAPAWGDGPLVISIAGAVATTAIGAVVVLPPPQEVTYMHERNLLTPLIDGQDPQQIFPAFVFRLLMAPSVGTAQSPRDELVATFTADIDDVVAEDQRTLARQILFGMGGVYDVRLLALHEHLLEELGAALPGLARDIDALGNAVTLLLRESPPQ